MIQNLEGLDLGERAAEVSRRIHKRKEAVQSEEATKTAMVMPFINHVLGYNVFDPAEVVPEFTADVGSRKSVKVDLRLGRDGRLVPLDRGGPRRAPGGGAGPGRSAETLGAFFRAVGDRTGAVHASEPAAKSTIFVSATSLPSQLPRQPAPFSYNSTGKIYSTPSNRIRRLYPHPFEETLISMLASRFRKSVSGLNASCVKFHNPCSAASPTRATG